MQWSDTGSLVKEKQGWSDLDSGLKYIAAAYVSVFLIALVEWVLWRMALQPQLLVRLGLGSFADADFLDFLKVMFATLAGLLYFVLLLAGQWQCIKSVPANYGTRECLLACIVVLVLAALISICAVGLEQRAPVRDQDLTNVIGVLAIFVAALIIINFLLFSHVLRVLHGWFDAGVGKGSVDYFFLFTSLFIGASIGIGMHWSLIPQKELVAITLAFAWSICLGWHLRSLWSVRHCIAIRLSQTDVGEVDKLFEASCFVPKKLSGVRRALKF